MDLRAAHRLRIVYALAAWRVAPQQVLAETLRELPPSSLRLSPLGTDSSGAVYYALPQLAELGEPRLFVEKAPVAPRSGSSAAFKPPKPPRM